MRTLTGTIQALALGLAVLTLTPPTAAQTIYRIVGADGKVTFSDKPPAAEAKVSTTNAAGRAIGPQEPALPFELRQVVARYPVTL